MELTPSSSCIKVRYQKNKITYVCLVSSVRPLKSETRRFRVTIGGDHLEYDDITATIPSALATVKIHLNRPVYTANAKYVTLCIKDYYYGTPNMPRCHYFQSPLKSNEICETFPSMTKFTSKLEKTCLHLNNLASSLIIDYLNI